MKDLSILYEDDEILLVNKPSGTAVQGGAGVSHPLDEELPKQLGYKVYLVHRLDKETAGILIVAKNPKAAARWTKLIATDEVSKEYRAICIGNPVVGGKPVNKGKIEGKLEAHGREQEATTYFEVLEECRVPVVIQGEDGEETKEVPLSLLKITLGTGRMHQIRIQMSKCSAPLAADDQHGNFKANKLLRKAGIRKLCLAAVKLTIPVGGKKQTFEIELPDHMKEAVDKYFV